MKTTRFGVEIGLGERKHREAKDSEARGGMDAGWSMIATRGELDGLYHAEV
jgi:hypothetical protein